ncbi:hypothetical protein Tsubulata_049444, partial [Turnera subulata]
MHACKWFLCCLGYAITISYAAGFSSLCSDPFISMYGWFGWLSIVASMDGLLVFMSMLFCCEVVFMSMLF